MNIIQHTVDVSLDNLVIVRDLRHLEAIVPSVPRAWVRRSALQAMLAIGVTGVCQRDAKAAVPLIVWALGFLGFAGVARAYSSRIGNFFQSTSDGQAGVSTEIAPHLAAPGYDVKSDDFVVSGSALLSLTDHFKAHGEKIFPNAKERTGSQLENYDIMVFSDAMRKYWRNVPQNSIAESRSLLSPQGNSGKIVVGYPVVASNSQPYVPTVIAMKGHPPEARFYPLLSTA